MMSDIPVETDNSLRPGDGDQLIAGVPVDELTVDELLAMEGVFGE